MITNKILMIGIFLLLVGMNAGCSRSESQIGTQIDRYEAICVQHEHHYGYGVTSHGHLVATRQTSCAVRSCERTTVLLGKYWWNDTQLSRARVSMGECERYL